MSTTQRPPRAAGNRTGRSRITGEVTRSFTFYFTEEELEAIRRTAAEEIGAAKDPKASSPNMVVEKAVRLYCGLPMPNESRSDA